MTLSEVLIAAMNPNIWSAFRKDWYYAIPAAQTILSRFTQDSFPPDVDDRELNKTRRRTMSLLDGLAKILVSAKESIAVGSALSVEEITIFIASDENRNLPQMVDQLRRLWGEMKEMNRNNFEEELTDDSFALMVGFRALVYEYCWNKHQERCDNLIEAFPHLNRVFDDVIVNSSCVVDNPPSNISDDDEYCDSDDDSCDGKVAYITTDELLVVKWMRQVFQAACKCKLEASKANLRSLGEYTMILNHILENTANDFFPRLGAIYNELAEKPGRFSMRRTWEKMAVLELAIKQVLRLLDSRRLSTILDKHFEIVPVQIDTVRLQYDVLQDPTIINIAEEASWTREDLKKKLSYVRTRSRDANVHPHCECALLSYFVKNIHGKENVTVPFEYIGLSKKLCIGCQLYYFSYNNIAEQHGLPKIYTRDWKIKECRVWAKPRDVPFQIDQDIEEEMSRNARSIFAEILRSERRTKK